MDDIPIKFEHKGKTYSGYLSPVRGMGSTQVWHLMVDRYYYGCLRYTDRWVFDSETMPDMAEFFGDYITARIEQT